MTTKTPHPNAAMILQVAQWVAEGETEFEYQSLVDSTIWLRTTTPFYHAISDLLIRLKKLPRKTIRIGNFDVPAPLTGAEVKGNVVWWPELYFEKKEDADLFGKAVLSLLEPKAEK